MSSPTTAPSGDRLIWPLLTGLKVCLAYWLGEHGRPVCQCAVRYHASPPPADACDCTCPNGGQGQAWVRKVELESSSTMSGMSSCTDGLLEVTVELGVYRCSPLPDEREATVPAEVEEAHAAGMYRDEAALRCAVRCCEFLDRNRLEPSILSEAALGPSGGCVGAVLQARMQVIEGGCGR